MHVLSLRGTALALAQAQSISLWCSNISHSVASGPGVFTQILHGFIFKKKLFYACNYGPAAVNSRSRKAMTLQLLE